MTRRLDAEALLAGWERLAEALAAGYRFGLDDWLNDVDGRRLLAAEAVLTARQRQRLAAADAAVLQATQPTAVCTWGSRNAERHGWSADEHWYYFVVPLRVGDEFAADLRRVR